MSEVKNMKDLLECVSSELYLACVDDKLYLISSYHLGDENFDYGIYDRCDIGHSADLEIPETNIETYFYELMSGGLEHTYGISKEDVAIISHEEYSNWTNKARELGYADFADSYNDDICKYLSGTIELSELSVEEIQTIRENTSDEDREFIGKAEEIQEIRENTRGAGSDIEHGKSDFDFNSISFTGEIYSDVEQDIAELNVPLWLYDEQYKAILLDFTPLSETRIDEVIYNDVSVVNIYATVETSDNSHYGVGLLIDIYEDYDTASPETFKVELSGEHKDTLLSKINDYCNEQANISLKDMFEESMDDIEEYKRSCDEVPLIDKTISEIESYYYENKAKGSALATVVADYKLSDYELLQCLKQNTTYIQDQCGGDKNKAIEAIRCTAFPMGVTAHICRDATDSDGALTGTMKIEVPDIDSSFDLKNPINYTTYNVELSSDEEVQLIVNVNKACEAYGKSLEEQLTDVAETYCWAHRSEEMGTKVVDELLRKWNLSLYEKEDFKERYPQEWEAIADTYSEEYCDKRDYVLYDNLNDKLSMPIRTGEDIGDFFSDDYVYDSLTSDMFEQMAVYSSVNYGITNQMTLEDIVNRGNELKDGNADEKAFYKQFKADFDKIDIFLCKMYYADLTKLSKPTLAAEREQKTSKAINNKDIKE